MKIPRVLLAAGASGSGKTLITCGLLQALVNRNLKTASFKCGPDYIDPMFHSRVIGTKSRNLDTFFTDENRTRYLLAKNAADCEIAVMEGVMGYYDGVGISCEKSTWTVSKETGTPTILIFNVKGMSHTMIPLIKGMIEYQENPVTGVILNRCSKGMYQLMKPEIEEKLGISVVGYFPQKEGIYIGSRHLGLMTAAEIDNLDEILNLLGETAEECIDIDLLLKIGQRAEELPKVKRPEVPKKKRARIAVAKDNAFCFYYKENLEILEQLGAELCYFSPVNDTHLPEDTDGIYLGGGYPETYRKELADNISMKQSICEAAQSGRPIIAECGGFMYVCNHLVETDDSLEEMLGLINTDVRMTKRLSMQFGYVTMKALYDTAFFKKDTKIRVHEFHYSKADKRGDACEITKYSGKCWNGLYVKDKIMAGYPHFYFHNCREVAKRFVDMAEEASTKRC